MDCSGEFLCNATTEQCTNVPGDVGAETKRVHRLQKTFLKFYQIYIV